VGDNTFQLHALHIHILAVGDARLLLAGVAAPPVEHSIPHNAARVQRSRASDMNTAAVANLRMELGAKNAPSEGDVVPHSMLIRLQVV
jgi:hypothetical protein